MIVAADHYGKRRHGQTRMITLGLRSAEMPSVIAVRDDAPTRALDIAGIADDALVVVGDMEVLV